MQESLEDRLRPVRVGVLLALVTLLFGFGLGAAFGGFEEPLKAQLEAGAQGFLESLPPAERAAAEKKAERVVRKSWTYLKRAHLHANGLGTASLALTVLVSTLTIDDRLRRIWSIGLGTGALGYPLFWLLAGLRAPGLGSTGAAKESLEWLALPSAGLLILTLVGAIVLFSWRAWAASGRPAS